MADHGPALGGARVYDVGIGTADADCAQDVRARRWGDTLRKIKRPGGRGPVVSAVRAGKQPPGPKIQDIMHSIAGERSNEGDPWARARLTEYHIRANCLVELVPVCLEPIDGAVNVGDIHYAGIGRIYEAIASIAREHQLPLG